MRLFKRLFESAGGQKPLLPADLEAAFHHHENRAESHKEEYNKALEMVSYHKREGNTTSEKHWGEIADFHKKKMAHHYQKSAEAEEEFVRNYDHPAERKKS